MLAASCLCVVDSLLIVLTFLSTSVFLYAANPHIYSSDEESEEDEFSEEEKKSKKLLKAKRIQESDDVSVIQYGSGS